MKLIPIHPENLSLAWKDVETFLKDGLEHADGKYGLGDIKELISAELLILWVVYNEEKEKAVGCVLTEVLKYPKVQALSIFLLAGNDFTEMLTVFDDLKEYAKGVGCNRIEFYGRPGWENTLKPLSFEKIHTVMRLNL